MQVTQTLSSPQFEVNQWLTQFSGAWAAPGILDDRLQLHAGIPIGLGAHGVRLGDVRGGFNFELVRNWSHSVWRPDVVGFTQLIAPTGASIYSPNTAATDVLGTGFWRVSFGALASKVWGAWDVQVFPAFQYSFARTFVDLDGDPLWVQPGPGGSILSSFGWSPGAGGLRLGLRVTWSGTLAGSVVRPGVEIVGAALQNLELGVDLGWLISPRWSVNASYSDQRLVALMDPAILNRAFALQIQHRWQR